MLESELASRGVVLHSGNITCKPLARYDQESHSLRTWQHSLDEDSVPFSATLPRSGMMRNGIVYQLPALVRLTVVTASSSSPILWHTPTVDDAKPASAIRPGRTPHTEYLRRQVMHFPTPTVSAASDHHRGPKKDLKGSHSLRLVDAVQMFPTPTSRDWKGKGLPGQLPTKLNLIGHLNPSWVEWLMGFPVGWTELRDSEMQSFQQLRKQLGKQSRRSNNARTKRTTNR